MAYSIGDCEQPAAVDPVHGQTVNDLMPAELRAGKEKVNPVFKFNVSYSIDDETLNETGNIVHLFSSDADHPQWVDMAVAATNWIYYDKNQSDETQVSNYRTAVNDNSADGWNNGLKGLHWALVGDPYDFTVLNRRRQEDGSGAEAQWLAITKTTIPNHTGSLPADSVIWTTSLVNTTDMETYNASTSTAEATAATATHFGLQMWKTGGDADYFLRTASLKTTTAGTDDSETDHYWRMVRKNYPGSSPYTSYFEMVPYSLSAKSTYNGAFYSQNYSKTMSGLGVTQQRFEIRTAVAKDEDDADNNCFDADVAIRTVDGTLRLTQGNMEIRYGDVFSSLPVTLRRYGCEYVKCYLNYDEATNSGTELTRFRELTTDYDSESESITAAAALAEYNALQAALATGRAHITYMYEVTDDLSQYFTTEQDALTDDYTWMNTYFYWEQTYSGTSVEIPRTRSKFDHYVYNSAGQIDGEVWIEEPYVEVVTNPSGSYPTKGFLNTHTSQTPVYADETTQSENDRQKWSLTGDPYSFTMKNYAQYLQNSDATVSLSGGDVLTDGSGAGQPFAIAVDKSGKPYLAVIDTDPSSPSYGNLVKLVDFDFSSSSAKSLLTVGDGINTEDPTGNTIHTTYKNSEGKTVTVKPFYLASLIKYADVLVYHLVMAHQHSLDADDRAGWSSDQQTGYDANGSPTGVYSRLLEFLKYWGKRNSTSYLSSDNITAEAIGSDYETAIGTANVAAVKSLLKQKGTLRNFLSYPVPDEEVSRVGIGNRPQEPRYMQRQFCTYYKYQRDVLRSDVDLDHPAFQVADAEWIAAGNPTCTVTSGTTYYDYTGTSYSADAAFAAYYSGQTLKADGSGRPLPSTFVEEGVTKQAFNIKWVSIFDVSRWSSWSEADGNDSKYEVTSADVEKWSGTGHEITAGEKKKYPSGYAQALSLQGNILEKLEDCHHNRKVLIDVVYEVNTDRFRFADRGRNTTAWYSMMTNNDVDGLMNFSYREGIGARQDKTHHYTNNYLWAPEGDPYGFVLRSRYATVNGTGWDDVAVTTRGKLPKGKDSSGQLIYKAADSAEGTVYDESAALATAADVQATYTSRNTSSGGIPFSNKRIIHRRAGQDGATTDGATNAVYEMFVGSNSESFLMHPTAAWMDNSDSEHESYFLKHSTSTTSTGTIGGMEYAGHHAYLVKGTMKDLLGNADANWRMKATSEQLVPYFKRSGYVGGLDPLKMQDFTIQNYQSQLEQSIAAGTELPFATLRKIQELVYGGTFRDNTGAVVAEGSARPAQSLLPMTFESTNLVAMKPGYYRLQAFSEDALTTDGQDLAGLKSRGVVSTAIQGIVGPRYVSGYRFESEKEDPDDGNNDGGRWLHFFETDMAHSTIHTFADLKAKIDGVDAAVDASSLSAEEKALLKDRDQFSHPAMSGNIEILPADFDASSIFQFTREGDAGYSRYSLSTQGLRLWVRPGGTEGLSAAHHFGRTELVAAGGTPVAAEQYSDANSNEQMTDKLRIEDIGGAAITMRTRKYKLDDYLLNSDGTLTSTQLPGWDDIVAENLKTNYVCIDRNHRYRVTCHTDNEMVEIGDHYTTDGYNGIQDTKWLLQPVGIREGAPYNELPLRVEVQQGGVKDQELEGVALTAEENRDSHYYGTLYVPFDTRMARTTDAAFTLTVSPAQATTTVTLQSLSQINGMGNPQYVPACWPVILRSDRPSSATLTNQDGSAYATRSYVDMYLPYDEPQSVALGDIKLQGEYLERTLDNEYLRSKLSAPGYDVSAKTVMVFGVPFADHSGHGYDRAHKQAGWYTNDNWARAEKDVDDIFSGYKAHVDSYTASTASPGTVAGDAQRSNVYVYHNKAYYLYDAPYAAPSPSKRHIVVLFGDESGIGEAPGSPLDQGVSEPSAPWPCDVYDLQGRRVAEHETPHTLLQNHPSLPKGVYVFGGRKVVVR